MSSLCLSTDGSTCDSAVSIDSIYSLSQLGIDNTAVLACIGFGFSLPMIAGTVGHVIGFIKSAIVRSMDSRS